MYSMSMTKVNALKSARDLGCRYRLVSRPFTSILGVDRGARAPLEHGQGCMSAEGLLA